MLFVNSTELIILLAVCAVAAACFIAAVALLIVNVSNQKRKQKPERELTDIVVDCNSAKREFVAGEEFTCEGLTVNALYNLKPKTEPLTQLDVFTEEEFARLAETGASNGLCVIKPNMEISGKSIVIVRYKGKATYYAITIAEPAQEPVQEPAQEAQEEPVREEVVQAEPVREETAQNEIPQNEPPIVQAVAAEATPEEQELNEDDFDGILRYDRSFTAKLIQSDDWVKERYNLLKNELLNYKGVKSRMSWKRESFKKGREYLVRFAFRGKTLCVFFPLNVEDYAESDIHLETVQNASTYSETPAMLRIKNDKRFKQSLVLITTVANKLELRRVERIPVDYYQPYEGLLQLVQRGLVKRVIKNRAEEAFFQQRPDGSTTTTVETPAEVVATETQQPE